MLEASKSPKIDPMRILVACETSGTVRDAAGLPVSVLFVRADSIYHSMPVDAWDATRDATKYQGPASIVAHPPCRAWGGLRANAKPRPGEKDLGPWAVEQVRKWGGVLEHPRASSLWPHCNLPRPGQSPDEFGGFSLDVDQHWWGHRAQKRTWLYVCGCRLADVPPMPITLTKAPCVITNTHGLRAGMPGYRKEVTKREREATPPAFAEWLVALAAKCHIRTRPTTNPNT